MDTGETPEQYVARLHRYLTKWRECAGLEPTFEGLEDLDAEGPIFQRVFERTPWLSEREGSDHL
jgi:hypothetical protein